MQAFSQLNASRLEVRQGRNSPRAERRADSQIADRAMQGMGSTLIDKKARIRGRFLDSYYFAPVTMSL